MANINQSKICHKVKNVKRKYHWLGNVGQNDGPVTISTHSRQQAHTLCSN